METIEAIKTRRSIRRFKQDRVPLDLLKQFVEAGIWAPTGGNRQYWKYIVIEDPEVAKKVKRVSPMVWGECPAAILVCYDFEKGTLSKEGLLSSDDPSISSEFAGFPSQNIGLAAHALGLGSCAIGGFNKSAVTKILDIPDSMEPVLLIVLGYPDESPEPKKRRPFSEITYLNSCNNPWEG